MEGDLCIIGLKVNNSNEFYAIYRDRIYTLKEAKRILKRINKSMIEYKIYRILDLVEVNDDLE